MGVGVLISWIYVGGVRVCIDPFKMSFFHSELCLDNSESFTYEGERPTSKMESKTNFSRCMRQSDGLT